MAWLVPGLLRPSVVKELYAVYNHSFGTQEKIERYCKVAQDLYDQGCVCSARLPLSLARRVINARIENDCFSTGARVNALCKIAQLSSLLSPGSARGELNEAIRLAARVSDTEKNLSHFIWSGVYREMGKAYIALDNYEGAQESLAKAREYAGWEQPLESADALCKIAAEEKKINEEAARATLETALGKVPGMWPGSYAKVHRLVTISNLYSSFDPEKAKEVLNRANDAMAEFAPHAIEEIEKSQKLINKAIEGHLI